VPEHVHVEASKPIGGGVFVHRFIVRRRFADAELDVIRKLDYSTSERYCADPECLGDEPISRGTIQK
jgi:hypothetical protein